MDKFTVYLSFSKKIEYYSKLTIFILTTVKPVLSGHTKRNKNGFQYLFSLNAGQMYCRMLPLEHSAILSTYIKLLFSIKACVLSILSGRLRQALLYSKRYL